MLCLEQIVQTQVGHFIWLQKDGAQLQILINESFILAMIIISAL